MKIGIFSGTFDPVHDGHIAFASEVQKRTELDKVVFLPEASPRRKKDSSLFDHRIRMLELALRKNRKMEAYRCRVDSHSAKETMKELHKKYGPENDYALVMGADVFEHIESWPGYEQLIVENVLIIGLRTEDDGELVVEIADRLNIKPTMIVSPFPLLSSSNIRVAIATGKEPQGLPKEVHSYVKDNSLYE